MKANYPTKILTASVMGLGFAFAPTAQATVLSNFLTFDGPAHYDTVAGNPFQGGGEDKMQDDSLSAFVDRDNSGGYSVGDVVYGMLTLSEFNSSGVPSLGVGNNEQIALLFSTKIVSMNGGSNGTIELGAIGNAADAYDLRTLLGVDAGIVAGLDNNTVGVMVSNPNGATPATDPLNFTTAQFSTEFTAANGWSQELSIGLVEATDFFNFDNTGPGLTGTDRGAFTIQQEAFSVKDWIDVDMLDYASNIVKGDFTLDFGTVTLASGAEQANGWTFRDQSSFFVNPVPEPSMLSLLGIGLLGLSANLRKRKA